MISQSFQKQPELCRHLEIGVIIAPSPQYFPARVIQSIIASVLRPPCPHSHPYTARRSKWKAQFSTLYRPWHRNALGALLSDLESQERLCLMCFLPSGPRPFSQTGPPSTLGRSSKDNMQHQDNQMVPEQDSSLTLSSPLYMCPLCPQLRTRPCPPPRPSRPLLPQAVCTGLLGGRLSAHRTSASQRPPTAGAHSSVRLSPDWGLPTMLRREDSVSFYPTT